MQLLIYGARSLALGAYLAIQELYPQIPVMGFLVTSSENNPSVLAGLPVREIEAYTVQVGTAERNDIHILIAAPEDQHAGMIQTLRHCGFSHYTCLDSEKESKLMERYFTWCSLFPSLHSLEPGSSGASLNVLMARFYKDQALKKSFTIPDWVRPIQVGAALTDVRISELTDDTGENISAKNVNYCELTALYWLWQSVLNSASDHAEYSGLFHYRRILDITERDLLCLKAHDVDVVLPFPTLHEPDILEHHSRYISESDWEAMKRALEELAPEYAQVFSQIFSQSYLYNYNLILAKEKVLADYCAWLFPILKRTEELSKPRGWERRDRYIGYLGENLLTLYFLYHQEELNIFHTGRKMLT